MQNCPKCQTAIGWTDKVLGKRPPVAGSWFVCVECAVINRYYSGPEGGLVLRMPTVEEFADADAGQRGMLTAMRKMIMTGKQNAA